MLRQKKIPRKNPLPYCNLIRPVLEPQKICCEQICMLPCRGKHELKPCLIKIKENDNLYAIFSTYADQMPYFICQWLKTFMLTYRGYFEEWVDFYLKTKGMSYDVWIEAIEDGRKGDILTLFGLSTLTDLHTYVHLHEGQYWITPKTVPDNHEEVLKACKVHLLYLG